MKLKPEKHSHFTRAVEVAIPYQNISQRTNFHQRYRSTGINFIYLYNNYSTRIFVQAASRYKSTQRYRERFITKKKKKKFSIYFRPVPSNANGSSIYNSTVDSAEYNGNAVNSLNTLAHFARQSVSPYSDNRFR